jgi:hypothetical protein
MWSYGARLPTPQTILTVGTDQELVSLERIRNCVIQLAIAKYKVLDLE